uniref:Ovule protein n=1 Tax=Romanomermis culicivorax TaxID=13658 RepID=A0A915KDU9_ROMCU
MTLNPDDVKCLTAMEFRPFYVLYLHKTTLSTKSPFKILSPNALSIFFKTASDQTYSKEVCLSAIFPISIFFFISSIRRSGIFSTLHLAHMDK